MAVHTTGTEEGQKIKMVRENRGRGRKQEKQGKDKADAKVERPSPTIRALENCQRHSRSSVLDFQGLGEVRGGSLEEMFSSREGILEEDMHINEEC